ncbi:MAG: thioredoxin family protein [Pseudomonadota bacterium]
MKAKAVFYHAGCPVCISAEENLANAIDTSKYDVESVHLGNEKSRIAEAESAGVTSVPAILLAGVPFHINFGASLADVKGGG